MRIQLDHLVVIAQTLDEGVQWCRRTLGIPPGPGGQHALMGTHNRLLRLDPRGPGNTYLEIIAIDPQAMPQRRTEQRRWFDMDDNPLRERLARDGPQLAHWVARTDDVAAVRAAWLALGIDCGAPLAASRMTPQGLLEWQITVRDDGARLFDGCLPTLIEWGERHPAPTMANSGLILARLRVWHPDADRLREALTIAGLAGPPSLEPGSPRIEATFATPSGPVVVVGAQ